MSDQLMTPKQAWEYLGIKRSKMYALIAGDNPEIPYSYVGRLKRIRKKDLDDWISSNRVSSSQLSSER